MASPTRGAASMRRLGSLSDNPAAPATRVRRARSGPRRSQDAQTVNEALEIERDTGRREGAASRTQRPIVRYGAKNKPRADAPPAPGQSLKVPKVIDDGSGFVLGLIGYALFLAYVKNGSQGVKAWLSNKFVNSSTGIYHGPNDPWWNTPAGKAAAAQAQSDFNKAHQPSGYVAPKSTSGILSSPPGVPASTPPSSTDPAGNPNVSMP